VGAFLICNQAGVTMRWTSGASFYWLFLALTGCAIQIALREQRQGQQARSPQETKAATIPTAQEAPVLPLRTRKLVYALCILAAIYGIAWNARLLASEFHAQTGNQLMQEGKYAEARDEYEKAVSLNPFAVDAYYKLGPLYMYLRDLDKSLQAYLRVQSLSPNYARLNLDLGGLYVVLNNMEKAKEDFQFSAKHDDLPTSWLQLGMAEAALGQLSEAREHIYKALQEDESLAELKPHAALGQAYQKAGKLSEAEDEFKKALEFDPKDDKVHANLGLVYSESGRLTEAIREYEEAIRLKPQSPYAYANLASVYTKQGKTKMALEMWKEVSTYATPGSDLARQAEEMLSPTGTQR